MGDGRRWENGLIWEWGFGDVEWGNGVIVDGCMGGLVCGGSLILLSNIFSFHLQL